MQNDKTQKIPPIIIREVGFRKSKLRFREPLTLHPRLTKSGLWMIADNRSYGIDCMVSVLPSLEHARIKLTSEIHDLIRVLWIEYALCDDALLTPGAIRLKERLLDAIEVVTTPH